MVWAHPKGFPDHLQRSLLTSLASGGSVDVLLLDCRGFLVDFKLLRDPVFPDHALKRSCILVSCRDTFGGCGGFWVVNCWHLGSPFLLDILQDENFAFFKLIIFGIGMVCFFDKF